MVICMATRVIQAVVVVVVVIVEVVEVDTVQLTMTRHWPREWDSNIFFS
jgi:hypothetical protein